MTKYKDKQAKAALLSGASGSVIAGQMPENGVKAQPGAALTKLPDGTLIAMGQSCFAGDLPRHRWDGEGEKCSKCGYQTGLQALNALKRF
jgi:predicted carbohydrate-binding protein with CBM5 and CBM33 domain